MSVFPARVPDALVGRGRGVDLVLAENAMATVVDEHVWSATTGERTLRGHTELFVLHWSGPTCLLNKPPGELW